MMAEWVEIPAHRVLAVPLRELHERYTPLDADGREMEWNVGCAFVLVRRDDRRVFKPARFWPADSTAMITVALEEV